jgi:hypothetical protein
MRKIVASVAMLLALTDSAYCGLSKGPHPPRVLNGYLLSGWCNDLPFRDEEAQLRANYNQAYSDGMCTMFVTFGLEITRREGDIPANYCLPNDVAYSTVAHDFAILLRRSREARESDPLDALINMVKSQYPCAAR